MDAAVLLADLDRDGHAIRRSVLSLDEMACVRGALDPILDKTPMGRNSFDGRLGASTVDADGGQPAPLRSRSMASRSLPPPDRPSHRAPRGQRLGIGASAIIRHYDLGHTLEEIARNAGASAKSVHRPLRDPKVVLGPSGPRFPDVRSQTLRPTTPVSLVVGP